MRKLFLLLFSSVAILGLIVLSAEVSPLIKNIFADDTDSRVTVTGDNSTPYFTISPRENTPSTFATPTNEGSNLTFKATAEDPDNDNYYFIVCKSLGATPSVTGAPTCASEQTICVSNLTGSGHEASCVYNIPVSSPLGSIPYEVQSWSAFVCDSSACSPGNQGLGDAGSPFHINYRAQVANIYTSATLFGEPDSTFLPGDLLFVTATADDLVNGASSDDMRIVVCSQPGATASGCTTPGALLCYGALERPDPGCFFTLPPVGVAGPKQIYSYVFDEHGLEGYYTQATPQNNPYQPMTYTIENALPTITNVILNNGNNINLTESADTLVSITARITDANSCQDLTDYPVRAEIYRSGISSPNCTDDPNNCYKPTSCTISEDSCSGSADNTITIRCTVPFKHYADPTTTGTQYPLENWIGRIFAADNSGQYLNEVSLHVELNPLIALRLGNTLNYGALVPGSNSGTNNQELDIFATGNVGLDIEVSGTDLTSTNGVIPVSSQQFSLSPFTYGTSNVLAEVPTSLEANITKTKSTTLGAGKLYWGISIPEKLASGIYKGANTVTGVLGETSEW